MDVNKLLFDYLQACEDGGPEAAGDFAAKLSDKEAKAIHDELVKVDSPFMVRPLWYCYKRQQLRWDMSFTVRF